ncbi:MAG: TROVE domain-containing protein, partial [Planctomycetaceae bacterium]|nr:TROVE domain-containing protein [Planctomycetaceae bacterium]
MANKNLFRSIAGVLMPRADARNEAGGIAYQRTDKEALAQYAASGCLNGTFYASAEEQLQTVLELSGRLDAEFIAKTAVYTRCSAHMKDVPALLCAILSTRDAELFGRVFTKVIDSPKMLRNFVQIMRSGVVGRKSLGSLPKRMVCEWLEGRSDEQLFTGSVGQSPSMGDVIRMVHPKPRTSTRDALYGYLSGRNIDGKELPQLVQQYEKFKRNTNPGKVEVPDVPFEMLTALPIREQEWKQIARKASWQMTRMNLNTFLRHGVFKDRKVTEVIENRLRNPHLIERSRVLPYQLMTAYTNIDREIPGSVREALQDAMEISIKNVPRVSGKVYVFPDVSGSMHSPVTGHRKGATSAVRCIDVAALVAAAVLRQNPSAEVIPFESQIVKVMLNPRDSVMTNAAKLAALPCGGTNCSAPLRHLNDRKARGDLVVYVSDNESWIDSPHYGHWGGGPTCTMQEWSKFKVRNPEAKMVCIDLQPASTTQAK